MMTYSKTGVSLTESFEGCKLQAYQDSKGVWTIGYGHTHLVAEGMICTLAQAEQWLQEDIEWAAIVVNALVKLSDITQNEFDALTDFVFNVGSKNFAGSTLLVDLNNGDIVGAAAQFDAWDHAAGKVIAGLLRRRQAETALFLGEPNAQTS